MAVPVIERSSGTCVDGYERSTSSSASPTGYETRSAIVRTSYWRFVIANWIADVHRKSDDQQVGHDVTMILNDGPLGFTLNGKGFPATAPIRVERGETFRIRYMNEGLQIHPMHLHGMPQLVVAKDGHLLARPRLEDTVLVAPGERVDVVVEATEPGMWALHCHILNHAEGPDGMFGMMTAVVVGQERR